MGAGPFRLMVNICWDAMNRGLKGATPLLVVADGADLVADLREERNFLH